MFFSYFLALYFYTLGLDYFLLVRLSASVGFAARTGAAGFCAFLLLDAYRLFGDFARGEVLCINLN